MTAKRWACISIPTTKMLAGFEVLDTETMLGDVNAQYILSDYKAVGDVKLPHHIKILKGGEPYSEVQFASIVVNDPKAADVFAIPEEIKGQAETASKDADAFPMKLVKVSNGVYHAQAFRHHSMVVEFPTFVAVVEAPYLDTQSRVLAKAVAAQFPNKPIKYAAVTHFHFDHIGGVRAMAALGATILVAKGHEPALRKVLEAPHTHPPDDLAKAGDKAGKIETFEGTKEIKEGNQSLQLITFTGSPHTEPMVMAYVPSARALLPERSMVPVNQSAGITGRRAIDGGDSDGKAESRHHGWRSRIDRPLCGIHQSDRCAQKVRTDPLNDQK